MIKFYTKTAENQKTAEFAGKTASRGCLHFLIDSRYHGLSIAKGYLLVPKSAASDVLTSLLFVIYSREHIHKIINKFIRTNTAFHFYNIDSGHLQNTKPSQISLQSKGETQILIHTRRYTSKYNEPTNARVPGI